MSFSFVEFCFYTSILWYHIHWQHMLDYYHCQINWFTLSLLLTTDPNDYTTKPRHIIIWNRCMSQGLNQYPMVTNMHSHQRIRIKYTRQRLPTAVCTILRVVSMSSNRNENPVTICAWNLCWYSDVIWPCYDTDIRQLVPNKPTSAWIGLSPLVLQYLLFGCYRFHFNGISDQHLSLHCGFVNQNSREGVRIGSQYFRNWQFCSSLPIRI